MTSFFCMDAQCIFSGSTGPSCMINTTREEAESKNVLGAIIGKKVAGFASNTADETEGAGDG
jgi:hypothetical protein